MTDVQWGALDYLVIDSPPGTGDEHLTVLDAIPDAGCIVVTTPQEISLADVRKALDFLKQVQAPVLGIVENMSGLSCPHCGKEIDLFKKGGGEQLAKQYELPFLGAIPLDPATVIAADRGVPVVSLTENSPARQGFMPSRTPLSPRPRPNRDFPHPICCKAGSGRSVSLIRLFLYCLEHGIVIRSKTAVAENSALCLSQWLCYRNPTTVAKSG